MSSIRFSLDVKGVGNYITGSNSLRELERQTMERALSEIEATFQQEFGRVGKFNLEFEMKPVGGKTGGYFPQGRRPIYRITAADTQTQSILCANPKWLSRFSQNAKL